jgi:hypothetical protein
MLHELNSARNGFRLNALLLVGGFLLNIWAMASSARSAETNILTVQLLLKDGYVRVDKSHSTLALRSDYQNWFQMSSNQMQKELTSYLDRIFKQRGKLIEQLFTTNAAQLWRAGKLNSKELEGWNQINAKWNSEFVLKLNLWIDAHPNVVAGNAKTVFDGLLGLNPQKPLEPSYELSPLEVLPLILEDSSAFQARGIIQYMVISPITAEYISPQGIRPREKSSPNGSWPGSITSTQLSQTLTSLKGQLWFSSKIERQLSDYLESRGVPVELQSQNSSEGPDDRAGLTILRPELTPAGKVKQERILFSQDPLLAGIFVRVAPEDTNSLRRALYMILPSDDFIRVTPNLADTNYFTRVLDPFKTVEGQTNYMVHLNLKEPPGSALRSRNQYVTGSYLTERLRYLGVAGFSAEKQNGERIATSPTNRYKTVEMLITPTEQAMPVSNSSDTAKVASNLVSKVTFDRGTNYTQPSSFETESSRRAEALRKLTYEPDFPNFFRVGTEYSPKQPQRYFAAYTRNGLTGGPNSISGQVGWQDGAFGDLTYTRDFFLFDSLNRRLQLSAGGFSDYQPQRLLAGKEIDQRRNGGEASANLDLFRDWHQHWLRLDLAASFQEVTLHQSETRFDSERLSTADLGLVYLYHWNGTPGSARMEILPRVRLGYAQDAGDAFIRPSVEITYHRFLGSFAQWECSAQAAWASSGTPMIEWPTLGGESSVRGYRFTAGTGRSTWSVQNELWIPIFLRQRIGLPDAIDRMVRRNLSLAAFIDVGGVGQTDDSFSGTKAGAGLGVRFVYNDLLTIRLDWAHALGEAEQTRGGGMFYLSVTTRRGF